MRHTHTRNDVQQNDVTVKRLCIILAVANFELDMAYDREKMCL